jgi:homoserine O-acetyltransferase
MTGTTLPDGTSRRIDSYRCTGTSPGRTGCVRVRLQTDLGPRIEASVAYELHGPDGGCATVVMGGISAGRHLAPTPATPTEGWWPGVVGWGCPLDPSRHRLVGFDYLGGPECPVRPPSEGSADDDRAVRPAGRGPDPITTHDQARALAGVLDRLALDRVTLIGSSYGGMVALAFAELFPFRADRLLVLCAAHRSHPMATAWRVLERRAVRFAVDVGRPETGLSLGRALAMTTYRSAGEFDARFDWRPTGRATPARFPVEDYLDARGAAFAERFEPEAFTRLSESIDLHAIDPERLTTPTTLVSFDTDALVPPWLVDELARRAPGVVCHLELSSVFGHDAFLKEVRHVGDAIGSSFCEGTTP